MKLSLATKYVEVLYKGVYICKNDSEEDFSEVFSSETIPENVMSSSSS